MELILRKKLRIRLIKYSFLFLGILVIAIILYKNFDSDRAIKNYEATEDKKLENIKRSNHSLSISNSIFQGLAKDLSPYKIIAEEINKLDEHSFNLERIKGNYLIDNNKININAKKGVFNSFTNDITLNGDVKITYQDIIFSTKKLDIETEKKEAKTDEAVVIEYKNTQIKSDSFETKNNLEIITFKGNVHSTINLDDFHNIEEAK